MFSSTRQALVSTLLSAACALPAAAATTTLYDPAAGTLPTAQGWTVLSAGAAATQSVNGFAYSLDTTGAGVGIYGNGRLSPVPLDTAAGFDIRFTLRVASESHTSTNRAGFTFLMLGSDPTKALELAFWADEVWSQDYVPGNPDRFVHGAGAAVDTTINRVYELSVRDQQFTLKSGPAVIIVGPPLTTLFTGSLRNYTAEGAPYTTPNFLFFGDNSTRGAASVQIGQMTITPVPEPAAAALLLAGLAVLGWRVARSRRPG